MPTQRCAEFVRARRGRPSVLCNAPASHTVYVPDCDPYPCCDLHAERIRKRNVPRSRTSPARTQQPNGDPEP